MKDPDAAIKLFTDCFVSSADTHAPLKERHIIPNQTPFLNKHIDCHIVITSLDIMDITFFLILGYATYFCFSGTTVQNT